MTSFPPVQGFNTAASPHDTNPPLSSGPIARFLGGLGEQRLPEPEPDPEEEALRAAEADQEAKALAQVADTGRRAAAWMRALPLLDGSWIRGPLADAVEEALTGLDLDDHDDIDRYGHAGISESARTRLDSLVYSVADTAPLAETQRSALFALIHVVQGIPKVLANDPWGVIRRGELAALCAIIDGATRTC
ncbi:MULTISPECIES: hypothetical protein [unclassified Streptomyces]|uniref:hypothetical protein n=1 Tax=unclassified Streptomyces TaxID=2593676 RepID=UPI0035DDCEC7